MEQAYAKAIESLVTKGGGREDEVFKKLIAHLVKAGRMKLLPQLLRELRVAAERNRSGDPLLEVAGERNARAAEKHAAEEGIKARAQVNPSLIRGWRLTANGTLIDRSGKRALIDLYRTIIK